LRRLVAPFALQVPGDGSYWLSCPTDRSAQERVAAFETWILREVAITDQESAATA
jgi:hypothetical protein